MRVTEVHSFQEYTAFIAAITSDISALHGLRFGMWSIQRFLEEFSAEHDLWDELAEAERMQLEGIILELERAATDRGVTSQRARELEGMMSGIAAGDEYADDAVEYGTLTISWLCMIDHTLKWCAHSDPKSLCAISEEFVNAWDFFQDDPQYNTETMFTFPDLTRELKLQAAFLNRRD